MKSIGLSHAHLYQGPLLEDMYKEVLEPWTRQEKCKSLLGNPIKAQRKVIRMGSLHVFPLPTTFQERILGHYGVWCRER